MSASEDAGAFVNSELDTVCTFFCGFLISVSGCAMACKSPQGCGMCPVHL